MSIHYGFHIHTLRNFWICLLVILDKILIKIKFQKLISYLIGQCTFIGLDVTPIINLLQYSR